MNIQCLFQDNNHLLWTDNVDIELYAFLHEEKEHLKIHIYEST